MREHSRMLLGLVVGAGLGLVAKAVAGDAAWLQWTLNNVTGPIGQIFLRLLFMLVVPMIFSALVMGVADLELRHLGRLGVRALARHSIVPKAASAPGDTSPAALLVSIVPDNPVKAAANGDYLGLIFFALVFGIALGLTRAPAAERLKEVIAGLYDVTLVLIGGVLKVAPLGVAALLFGMTARLGFDVLRQLAAYVGVVLLGLALHMFVVYSLSVRFFGGRNPVQFFRDVRMAAITAFSTASSNATLPTALKVAEENLRLPPNVARFVITAGASMNQN